MKLLTNLELVLSEVSAKESWQVHKTEPKKPKHREFPNWQRAVKSLDFKRLHIFKIFPSIPFYSVLSEKGDTYDTLNWNPLSFINWHYWHFCPKSTFTLQNPLAPYSQFPFTRSRLDTFPAHPNGEVTYSWLWEWRDGSNLRTVWKKQGGIGDVS